MVSQIDPTVPVFGSPTTASVRNNFLIARNEITALQNAIAIVLPLPITSGGTGADDLVDAQINLQVLPLSGGTMTGQILLTAAPTDNRSAVPKSYVDGNFPVSISNGGTGATSASQALINLGGVGLNSPSFTGVPTAPTAPASDSSTIIATTAYVKSVIAGLPVGVTQLTVTGTGLSASGSTGNISLTLNTPVTILNGGTGASTAVAALNNLGGAPLASPTFTGVPAAPTAPPATNSTQLATCAFVTTAIANAVAGVSSITAGVGLAVTPPGGVGNVTVALQTPVTVANGGTGANSGNTAFDSLLGGISSGSGFITRQTGGAYSITPATLTPANRPLIINGSNAISTSAITTDNGTTFGVNGGLSVGSATSTAGLLALYDRTTAGQYWNISPTGGTLTFASTVVSGNVASLSSQGLFTVFGSAAGIDLTDRTSGHNWAIYSSGDVLTFNESVTGVGMNMLNGQLFVPGSCVIGTGNQSTSLPFNVNSNGSAAQFSAVTGSGINIRMDNPGAGIYFLYQTATNVGTIGISSTTITFNPASDGRLKENRQPIDPAFLDKVIGGLEPISFDWVHAAGDEDKADYGFVAQDVFELIPQAVSVGSGEPGEDDFRPWGLDQTKLIPFLVAEAKAVQQRVAMLEAELRSIKEVLEAATAVANTPAPTPTPTPTPARRRS